VCLALISVADRFQCVVDVFQHLVNFLCFALLEKEAIRSASACFLYCVYQSVSFFILMIVEDISECEACWVHVDVFIQGNFNNFVNIAEVVDNALFCL
jgi:hypothetical protein